MDSLEDVPFNVNAIYIPLDGRLKGDRHGSIAQSPQLEVKDVKEMFVGASKRYAPYHQIVLEARMNSSSFLLALLAH
jgi:hypothetical protein